MTDSTPKKKKQRADSSLAPISTSQSPRRVPLWQALVLPVAAILVFFLLLEGGLALFGVKPALKTEDPFVGFTGNVPLFVPSPDGQRLTTAPNKLNFFNAQSFARQKAPDTYRVFTLGGSTTYGHPYTDSTSFAGWMRELLPAADGSKNWEVINAGGISYASYRVAHLMEELVNYQPDLFIIYTGQNEFLEERTYSQIRDIPPVVRSTVSLLAGTRTWSAMSTAVKGLGINPQAETEDRDNLALEVDTKLDQSAGLDRYTRDDPLKENILKHFRISLERMVTLARSAGAQVIFVTPASSLNDCSPFKSEHTPGIDAGDRDRSARMLAQAKEAIRQENWKGALDLLEKAAALDPRHAELQYRRGQALLALGRFDEAESALRRARDEDVCPLRALTPMVGIVAEVARDHATGLVDFVELLRRRMQDEYGHPILGQEYFLDHVHPTIEGYKRLALALIQSMIDQGTVRPEADWGEQAVATVAAKIESGIDREVQGQALAVLARTLLWAKKREDAARLAGQAQAIAGEYHQVAIDSASVLTSVYVSQGQPERALELLYSAIERAPGAIEIRYKLAQVLGNSPFWQWEEAAANLLLICHYLPNKSDPQALFGISMAKRGRPQIAYASLMEALRLNPNNGNARAALTWVQSLLGGQASNPQPPHIMLDYYPSRAPHKIVQMRPDPGGRPVADGIEAEFYENGRLKRFLDVVEGVPHGLELTWDPDGALLSRVVYRDGIVVEDDL
jgi:Flp pilus assembly protein TadD